jgi:hypothetical protein
VTTGGWGDYTVRSDRDIAEMLRWLAGELRERG